MSYDEQVNIVFSDITEIGYNPVSIKQKDHLLFTSMGLFSKVLYKYLVVSSENFSHVLPFDKAASK